MVDVLYVESDNFAALSSFTHHTIDVSIQSGIGFIKEFQEKLQLARKLMKTVNVVKERTFELKSRRSARSAFYYSQSTFFFS